MTVEARRQLFEGLTKAHEENASTKRIEGEKRLLTDEQLAELHATKDGAEWWKVFHRFQHRQ